MGCQKGTDDEFTYVLAGEYHDSAILDGKPEKGERKIADDFLVLLNEHIERVILKPKSQPLQLNENEV